MSNNHHTAWCHVAFDRLGCGGLCSQQALPDDPFQKSNPNVLHSRWDFLGEQFEQQFAHISHRRRRATSRSTPWREP